MGKVSAKACRVSVPGKRFTANRRLSAIERDLIRPHCKRVGEVIHAYNSAHASLFKLFMRLAANEDYEQALDLWHTAKTDRGQRDMLEVVVRHSKTLNQTYRRNILWSIASLNELAQFRNEAAHTDMIWYYDRLVPNLGTKAHVMERLLETPFEKNWRPLRGDLIALSTYLGLIDLSLAAGSTWPLTRKPQLQLARSTSVRTQTQRRHAKTKARERQRQSSRT